MTNEIRDQKGSKLSILQTLRLQGGVSRIELAGLTGLSRATISGAISELMECGLVYETSEKQSTGGRPATTLELVPDSKAIIGADFVNNTWTLGAFDLLGNEIETAVIPVATATPERVFQALAEELKAFAEGLDAPSLPLLGLGVPGLVDADHRYIRSASESGWYNVSAAEILQEEIGWQTVLVNRHRARGLAECRYGAGQSYHNMIYIGVGSGIAAGMFVDRRLVSGANGGAGEIGHSTVNPEGPLCPCGNHGCLQVMSAGLFIEQEFRKSLRLGGESEFFADPGLDLQLVKAGDVCLAADQGDELAVRVVKEAASYLGIVMGNLVNFFNPEVIILGGPIPSASILYVETATSVMKQRAMRPLAAETAVKTASLKENGGALGAANFALDKKMSISLFNPVS